MEEKPRHAGEKVTRRRGEPVCRLVMNGRQVSVRAARPRRNSRFALSIIAFLIAVRGVYYHRVGVPRVDVLCALCGLQKTCILFNC